MDKNVVGWFEIPVLDLDRAQKFYEKVLGLKLEHHTMGPLEVAWFPWKRMPLVHPDHLSRQKNSINLRRMVCSFILLPLRGMRPMNWPG
jgi:catechol-2,3-dioxygenase